jgi:predicted TIM-barrel fold metal-dependent hydrolase
MPAVTVDTHVHLASADERRYPRPRSTSVATRQYVHPVEAYLREMDGAGVQFATIVQPFGVYGSDNSYQADSAGDNAGRLRAICGVTPPADTPEAVRGWIVDRHMSGVRLNTWGARLALDDPAVLGLVEEAGSHGVPVVLLVTARRLQQALGLAHRYPDVTFVLDHLGGALPDVEGSYERLAEVANLPNMHLKVTTEQIMIDDFEARMTALIDVLGPAPFLWGSNYPVTDLGGYTATVDRARQRLSFLGEERRAQIMGGNAMRMWPSFASGR